MASGKSEEPALKEAPSRGDGSSSKLLWLAVGATVSGLVGILLAHIDELFASHPQISISVLVNERSIGAITATGKFEDVRTAFVDVSNSSNYGTANDILIEISAVADPSYDADGNLLALNESISGDNLCTEKSETPGYMSVEYVSECQELSPKEVRQFTVFSSYWPDYISVYVGYAGYSKKENFQLTAETCLEPSVSFTSSVWKWVKRPCEEYQEVQNQ